MKCLLVFDSLNDLIFLKSNKSFAKHIERLAKVQGLLKDDVELVRLIFFSSTTVLAYNGIDLSEFSGRNSPQSGRGYAVIFAVNHVATYYDKSFFKRLFQYIMLRWFDDYVR